VIEDEYIIKRQPMYSGQADAAARQYFRYTGRSGRTWLVADQPNAADHIFVSAVYKPGDRSSFKGFGGAALVFPIVGQDVVTLTGPWHTNSEAFLADVGVDIRDRHLTFVVVARERVWAEGSYEPTYKGLLYLEDGVGVVGSFNRGDHIAEDFADLMGEPVYLYSASPGGSSSMKVAPMKGAAALERAANRTAQRDSTNCYLPAHQIGDASPVQAAIIGS